MFHRRNLDGVRCIQKDKRRIVLSGTEGGAQHLGSQRAPAHAEQDNGTEATLLHFLAEGA